MKSFLPDFSGAAGAAFLLRTPARKSLTFQHGKDVVTVRQGGIYATVHLSDVRSDCALRTHAWQVLQEAFDIYALAHSEALATRYGNREYLLWSPGVAGYELTCVDTMDMPWSMSIHEKGGFIDLASGVIPIPYHPSFRFFRLAQLTDDLFDAYRNACLCLECLVRDESTKIEGESETTRLKRVLGNCLSAAIPDGMDIDTTIGELCELGQLPLFLPKTGAISHRPQGEEWERVQALLEKLMILLSALLQYKFANYFSAGSAQTPQAVSDARARAAFQFDKVVYKYGSRQFSAPPKIEIIEKPRRFGNLWACVNVEKPKNFTWIDEVELLNKGEYRGRLRFPEYVPLAHVSRVRFEFNLFQHPSRTLNTFRAR